MMKKNTEWNHAAGITDKDTVMSAADLVKALFFELDISASSEVQTFISNEIESLATNYDFLNPSGYYTVAELQSMFSQQGNKVWGAMNHYKDLKGDDSLSTPGTYDPTVWNSIVDWADYYSGNNNG